MAKKARPPQPKPSTPPATSDGWADTENPDVAELLREVDRLLQENQPATALDLVFRSGVRSPQLINAQAVCQLRMGCPDSAVETLRPLVMAEFGVALRDGVPDVLLANYATAQIAAGKVALGLDALAAVRDKTRPAVGRLREAVNRWRAGMTLFQSLDWWTGGQPKCPVVLDFPPGDLE